MFTFALARLNRVTFRLVSAVYSFRAFVYRVSGVWMGKRRRSEREMLEKGWRGVARAARWPMRLVGTEGLGS